MNSVTTKKPTTLVEARAKSGHKQDEATRTELRLMHAKLQREEVFNKLRAKIGGRYPKD